MPELPEVEHVARALQSIVNSEVIMTAELRRARLAPDSPPEKFAELLAGSAINFVHRRGKHILFDLSNGRTLIVHLRMSGRFMLLSQDHNDPKFAHAVFYFGDDTRLVFEDQRHFGLMKIVETAELYLAKELSKLAPEPFSKEFSVEYLREKLALSNRPIKEFLLDQTKVCGLGNIYAAEVLFHAGIHPIRPARIVSKPKALLLHENIISVLSAAIENGSTTDISRENIGDGIYGEGSDARWLVYDREGQPCPKCNSLIKRIKQAGRSTWFCSRCQRK